jgi:hypothetical protein
VVDSFDRLLSIWIRIRNVPKQQRYLLGLHGYRNFFKFPNHSDTNPLPLLIPVDNNGVVKELHRTINAQTPTYDLLSPDFDILQAIRAKLNELPIRTDIAHVKDTKTDTSCGTNLTSMKKSMYLLINKLTPSTRNPYG